MKILHINKFFYPKGGTETYLFSLMNLLEKKGHKNVTFSQKHPLNYPSPNSDLFISDLPLDKFSWSSFWRLGRLFWSFSAARKISALIKKERPDLIHLHNIYHQISPSILPAIKKFNLPIVMTVHDFKLIKHDYTLRIGQNQPAKNSRLVDLLLKLEFAFHKKINIYRRYVDMFIAPSLFVKEQLIKNGFDAQKIIVIPHFIDLERYQTQPKPIGYPYVLFFGRLDESKGADVLINAFAQIKTDHKLVIIGSGPEEINLKNQVKKLNLTDKVVFIGRKEKNELLNFIQNADFAVFPSRVHETFGLGALETFACGKPVIASRAGSFNNLIQPQQTGLLFTSDNHQELAEQIQYLLDNPNETTRMGKNAYAFSLDYSANKHYEKISAIYEALIDYEKKKK